MKVALRFVVLWLLLFLLLHYVPKHGTSVPVIPAALMAALGGGFLIWRGSKPLKKQSVSSWMSDAAVFWHAVVVIIGLIVCGWAIVEKEWLGLIASIAVIFFEARSIRRSTTRSFFKRAQ